MKIISTLTLFLLLSSPVLYAKVKIMPLGDSITLDWRYDDPRNDTERHGYRNHLWYKLNDAKYDVDFVGTQHTGSAIEPSFDIDHEGYTGYTTYKIANLVCNKLEVTSPDIILLHIGTNDSLYSSPSDMTGLETILNEIDDYEIIYDKHITVILARIIPLPKAGNWIDSFNSSLDAMVENRINNGDDIIKVDMNVIDNLIDGIHPTDSGYQQMASIWFNALETAFIPTPPKNLVANEVEIDSATLSWESTSSTIDGYKIYKGAVLIATLPKDTTSYALKGLTRNTKYTYTIVAYSEKGITEGQDITFTTATHIRKNDYAYLIPIYGLLN